MERKRKEPTTEVRQSIDAVNARLTESAGELVLMYWHDLDIAKGHNYGVFDNPKIEFEGQHIAVGVLTGEPLKETYFGPHWCGEVPTGRKSELLIWPKVWHWDTNVKPDPTNLGGAYPSFTEAEDTGADWGMTGESELRTFRAMQVVIGADEIQRWLRENKHTAGKAGKIFQQIVELTSKVKAA